MAKEKHLEEKVREMLRRAKLSPQASGAVRHNGTSEVISMKAVSQATGINYFTLSRFASGKSPMTTERLHKVKEYLEGVL